MATTTYRVTANGDLVEVTGDADVAERYARSGFEVRAISEGA